MIDVKSVFIRKRNNNYNVIVEYYNEEYKIKQKSVGRYTSKREAEKHLVQLKNDINNNKFSAPKDITVAERFKMHIESNREEWSPNTTKNYEVCLEQNVEPFFRRTKLQELTALQLQQYISFLYKKYSYSGMKLRYSFIATVLKECYRLREIQENPCNFIKLPTNKEIITTGSSYTKEEVKEILCKVDNELELPITMAFLTGMRRGEIIGLRWRDVDLASKTISVNQTAIYVNSALLYKQPKTKASIRTIHIQDELVKLLRNEKSRQNRLKIQGLLDNEYNLVCLNRYNDPWIPQTLAHCYKVFCEANNIRQLRLHDIRHTHATLLLLAGVDFKTISNRLGHTSVQITIDRYSHVLEEMDKTAVVNLSNLLS